jgi:hypothetical protein
MKIKLKLSVSITQLNRALYKVQNELYINGLWNEGSPLTEVEIIIDSMPTLFNLGIFTHAVSKYKHYMGYKEGIIYITKFSIGYLENSKYSSVRDLVRHEYAHAFAEKYDHLIRKKLFEITFGDRYYSAKMNKMSDDAYFTEYAKENSMEDFAETFMLYLKWKGKLPKKFTNKQLIKKWNYVENVLKTASQS